MRTNNEKIISKILIETLVYWDLGRKFNWIQQRARKIMNWKWIEADKNVMLTLIWLDCERLKWRIQNESLENMILKWASANSNNIDNVETFWGKVWHLNERDLIFGWTSFDGLWVFLKKSFSTFVLI